MMSTGGMINIQFPEQEHGVLSRLNAMRLQGQLCDVAVRAGEREFTCHQAVLAASCGHFHSIFVQGVLCFPKKPTKETLDLSFISAEVFSIILDYVYTANLRCSAGIIEDVLQAAKVLEIEPLMRQLPVFVGNTLTGSLGSTPISSLKATPISSLEAAPIRSLGGTPIRSLGTTPISNLGGTPISTLGNTGPISSLDGTPSVSVDIQVIRPAGTVSSVVAASRMGVPESLAEMLTEPEENVQVDQPTSQSTLENVVVKQELPDSQDTSQDMWSPFSTSFLPIPQLSPDNSEDEDFEMAYWTPWVNDEYSRVLSAEKVAELEQICRRCGRKDNSVRYFVRALKEWCLARNKSPDFETLPCDQLARLLQQFYYEVRNPAGRHYGAQTMLGFRSAIKTYLQNHPANPSYNISSDAAFIAANRTLQKVVKDCPIKFEAKFGIRAVNIPDLQKLFDTGTLGTSTPTSLQRLIWFYFTVHFHVKTMEEWLMLKKEDLTLHEDLTLQDQLGEEKAYFTLRRPGTGSVRLEDRMYAAGGKLCPVAVTKLYLKKLNPFCNSLLQKPVRVRRLPRKGRWYKDHPPGRHYISLMMKGISQDAGLSLNYTNIRIRKTTRQDLVFAGIFPSSETITRPAPPVVAPLATSQGKTYNHSTLVMGSNADLGASSVLQALGHSPDMASPKSQRNRQVGGTLGSVMQTLGLPNEQADFCVKQESLTPPTTQNPATELQENVADHSHSNGTDRTSEIKTGPRKGVRRSTRKTKLVNFLEDSDDDQDDDWLPEG